MCVRDVYDGHDDDGPRQLPFLFVELFFLKVLKQDTHRDRPESRHTLDGTLYSLVLGPAVINTHSKC
jgi:hypothetical protein